MQHGSYKLTNFLSYDETTEMTSCLVTKYSLSFYVKDSDNEFYLQIMLELFGNEFCMKVFQKTLSYFNGLVFLVFLLL